MPTIAEHLESDIVELGDLHSTYGPMLHLVNELIGVIPDCDTYLEIWPPGFRTYNLCVPNFLNLPASLIGRRDVAAHMGLAMYIASRTADCPYCSAHTCSFALRRGASPEAVDGSARTDVERAVVALAEGMSNVPTTWDPSLIDDLGVFLSADDIEWVAMSVGMMGFLNKFMDAIAVPLEVEAINDVAELIEPTGWDVGQAGWRNGAVERVSATVPTDSIAVYGRIARRAPRAVLIERGWTKHLPKSAPDLRRYLLDTHGVDVPILTKMRHQRPMRALAAMIDQNLNPDTSEIGIGNKALAGLAYAAHTENADLVAQARSLAARDDVPASIVDAVTAGSLPDADERPQMIVRLARAFAPSPAQVTSDLAEAAVAVLSPAEIIEVAVWISVQQSMHRLGLFYG